MTHGFGLVEVCQVHLVGINADCSRRVVDRRMVESSSDNVANSDFIGIVYNFQGRPQQSVVLVSSYDRFSPSESLFRAVILRKTVGLEAFCEIVC